MRKSSTRPMLPKRAGTHFDTPLAPVDTQVVCVDKKRQWSRWKNVWHSSAIRSTLYMLGAPVRGMRRLFA